MLFIPDLHLEPKYSDRIISTLQTIIMNHPDDSIVFLGDYVYHFSYHKPSLLAFLSLCLSCAKQGKHLYILAGNHDWLGSDFVFQEAKIFLDHFSHKNLAGSLTFITKPSITTIQGQQIAFLPSCINPDDYALPHDDTRIYEENAVLFPEIASWLETRDNAAPKNLRYSYAINNRLMHHNTPDLMIIHHRYIGPCRLPGLKTSFRLDEGTLHAARLRHPARRFVSGHIHTPFALDNRVCLGSFWNTSQTEYNHPKIWGHRDTEKKILTLTPVTINPLIRLHIASIMSGADISQHRATCRDEWKRTILSNNKRTIHCPDHVHLDNTAINVHLTLDPGTDPEAIPLLSELTTTTAGLRRSFEKEQQHDNAVDALALDTHTLNTSLLNRRDLLIERIKSKYPDSYETYYVLLQNLDILK
ncbi:MAG: metallophosphoesterase [Candidatus Absconditabacterales bacterium]|nr:metallophosphoesterase [Candidatus Absconditabacterales bacterium]